MEAACSGDTEALARRPDLINTKIEGATALHYAAFEGHVNAVEWLLDHGADPTIPDDEYGATAIDWANEKGREDVVEYMLRRGVPVGYISAVSTGCLAKLKEAAALDASILARERDWGTVVHSACIWGRIECLEWLARSGADLTRRSKHGFTPLEIAEAQAQDGRRHAPIVTDERKAALQRDCAIIAARLRELTS